MSNAAPTPGGLSQLDRLCIQIERAWEERRDYDLPARLAEEHPALAGDLLSFFDYLLRSGLGTTTTPEQRERSSALLEERLRANGLGHIADAIARARSNDEDIVEDLEPVGAGDGADGAVPSPRPAASSGASSGAIAGTPLDAPPALNPGCRDFSDYAREFGHKLTHVAEAWELPVDTAHAFIRNGSRLPRRAQRELARRAADRLPQVSYDVGLLALRRTGAGAAEGQPQRAASRAGAYRPTAPFSYRQALLDAPSSLSEADKQFWLSLEDDAPEEADQD